MLLPSLRVVSRTLPLRRTWTSLTRAAESLTVHALNDTTFPYIWLRDSSQSPECVNPITGSKRHPPPISHSTSPRSTANAGFRSAKLGCRYCGTTGRRVCSRNNGCRDTPPLPLRRNSTGMTRSSSNCGPGIHFRPSLPFPFLTRRSCLRMNKTPRR
jgi:hypothetical protein